MEVRRYSYSAVNVPHDPVGDLPDEDKRILPDEDGAFTDVLPPLSVTVYTSRLNNIPAPHALPVQVLREDGKNILSWNDGGAIGYTRILRNGQKIHSTTLCTFADNGGEDDKYEVYFVSTC